MKINCEYTELVDIVNLRPHTRNANKHPENQIKVLSKLIDYQGWRLPIIVSNFSKQIVAGHGRLEAAKKLGFKQAPVSYQDFDSEEQELAFLYSDNKIQSYAKHDDAFMIDQIRELDIPDFDFELFGIPDFEMPKVFEPQCDDDEIPETVDTRCKLGDIWQLGEHRLMCGDSTSIDAVEKLMNGEKADMWIADPPFGVSYMDKNAAVNGGVVKNQTGKEIKSDTKSVEELCPFWRETAVNAYLVTTDKASNYWCACQGSDKMMMMMMMMMDEAGWNIRHELIWVKSSFVFGRSDYHYRHEPIIYGWKKDGSHEWFGDRKQSSVFEIDRPHKSDLHPTTKPIALFEQFILNSTKPKQKIFESFGGSGTTLIASEKNDRVSFTMELDPHYCDVILARWEKYTGRKAELISQPDIAFQSQPELGSALKTKRL